MVVSQQNSSNSAERSWWLFAVRGALGVLLGTYALAFPSETLSAIALLLGSYLVVDGILAIVKAFRLMHASSRWGWIITSGVLQIIAGALVFLLPYYALLSLSILIGLWAIITGAMELFFALSLPKDVSGVWLYAIFGAISIAFGIYVVAVPQLGFLYLDIAAAIYGFSAGIAMLTLAFRMRLAHGSAS